MSDFRIAFIGTGIMGRPMCLNLLKAGFKLAVHSRTKSKAADVLKAGAVWADSPAAAAKNADVVITCVTDTPDVKKILLGESGVIKSARLGLICIDMSTISPFETQQMAKTLAEKKVILIDAPVSGGQIGAEQGKLSIMAGGDKETVEKLKPVFEAMGKSITYCGVSGFGQITKLANQVMVIHTIMSVAEGLAFADSAGLDLNTTLSATSAGSAGSNSLKALGPKVIAGDFAPAFMVDLQLKDLRLVLEYAEKINQPLPGVALAKELLNVLKTQGRGRDGTQALYEVIKQVSGKKSKERGKILSKLSFAVTEQNSKGRNYPEPDHAYRTAFERDRDRIIHSSAFRRLEGKTQVFTPHINDHYRTRATHSVEVAQIGRTLAKALGLNEALTEAACLAHDLGHSPFGHSGEVAMNYIMKNFGGFEHNAQTLRIVDLIERPYPDFIGLNLMYETRLALAKHRSAYDNPKVSDFAEKNCSLEGQVCDIADRIAYNCHDLEDGLRAKLLNYEMITQLDICKEATEKCRADKIGDSFIRNTRIAKTIIDILVGDCIDISRTAIEINNLSDLQRVYKADNYIISLSVDAEEVLSELEKFLHKNMYEHNAVKSVSIQVGGWLEKVFKKFLKNPQLMPKFYQKLIDEFGLERTVCDYISGMTDWYCLSMIEN